VKVEKELINARKAGSNAGSRRIRMVSGAGHARLPLRDPCSAYGNGATLDHLRAKFPDLEDDWLEVTSAPFEALTEAEARVLLRFEDAGALKERVLQIATARGVREAGPLGTGVAEGHPEAPSAPRARPAIREGDDRYFKVGVREFVRLADGSLDFGEVPQDISEAARAAGYTDLPPGKIRLEKGWDNPATGEGIGELHVEGRHGNEIRNYREDGKQVYRDGAELVADVAANYNRIGRGHSGRLILGIANGREKIAIIELEPTRDGYTVRTAGLRNPGWLDRESRALPWRPAEQPAALGSSAPGTQDSASNVAPGEVFINWARIDGPEDVKAAIQQMADARVADIDQARRGVRTHAMTQAAAAREDAFKLLMERRAQGGGTPLSAEQSVAVRQLWTASGGKLIEVAQLAAAPIPRKPTCSPSARCWRRTT
jgi:hypothetical protein